MTLRSAALSLLSLALGVFGASLYASAQPSYMLFESGPVRPVALSPNGEKLFVVNTPDGYLEIFDMSETGGLLASVTSVPVGLEPVAVAARSNSEVWVVNHLSDSISIVDVASSPPRVVRTLLVGDEPRDIVFAGSPQRAFISTAHRGQHRTHASIAAVTGAGDPELTTEGVGRADVWVFDAASPGSALGGVPVEILTFFSDTPRALATDGTTVWVAAFHSGNQTTGVPETEVPDTFVTSCGGGGVGQGVPGPSTNHQGTGAPDTGLIVKWDGSNWVDALGCTWDNSVELSLPDQDVFEVNANTLVHGDVFTSVGTILFNMVVNPVTGKLYVTNTESPNDIRFEGPGNEGTGAFLGSTVQGHLSESRVTVIDPGIPATPPDPKHLNSHINYSLLHTTAGVHHATIDAQVPHSLATPLQVVVSDNLAEQKVYIAAFGSAKIGVFDASDLEAGTFDPTVESANYIPTGGGPAGLALSDDHDRLYVLTRFDQSVSVFDVEAGAKNLLQTVRLPSPEPDSVVDGRPILYDAVATSGNGEASCASCHIFGDFDSLAWNLGDPDGDTSTNNQPSSNPFLPVETTFHPMKGPMTTQTLRGLSTHGATHWRGDRLDGVFGTDPCTGSSGSNAPCDEEQSFLNFIVAFEGLVGKEGTISTGEMEAFTDFTLQMMLPPNPVRALDNTLENTPLAPEGGGNPTAGKTLYFSCDPGNPDSCFDPGDRVTDVVDDCDGCHNLDPAAGFFGSGGEQTAEGEPQNFKVSHLRNVYQKIGMFGLVGENPNTGDQVRGFGFLHDGVVDTLFDFVFGAPFSTTADEARDLEQFMLRFPSDIAPVVGQQVSLGPGNPDSCIGAGCVACGPSDDTCQDVDARIDLLHARAGMIYDSFVIGGAVPECDVVVKTVETGAPLSYRRLANATYLPDDGGTAISESALRAKGATQDLHYQCTPPGSGERAGHDRDLDSVPNGQDNCPAWPNGAALGTCTAGEVALVGTACTSSGMCGIGGFCSQAQEDGDANLTGDACEPAFLPEPGFGFTWGLGAVLVGALARRRRA